MTHDVLKKERKKAVFLSTAPSATAARLPDHPVHRAREEYCYIVFGSVIEVYIC